MKHEELISGLKQLYLHEIAVQYVEISKISEKEKRTYEQYLAKLTEIELAAKHRLKVSRLIKDAKLPIYKSLDSYNFDVREGITAPQLKRLASGEFVRQSANVVFYGGFGVGKTHLAIALIRLLCESGFRCLFSTTHGIIGQLLLAKGI